MSGHASTLLGGRAAREIVRTNTGEALHRNRVGQILCTLQALAAAAALRDETTKS
jgi:[acyl-carrier-protein] S-malonyltransferase